MGLKKAIAIDFDGTLFEEIPSWPAYGAPIWKTIHRALEEQRNGAELILWTMREGKALELAIHACKSVGLTFDAINDNCEDWKEHYHNNPRKVGANEYWDNNGFNPSGF